MKTEKRDSNIVFRINSKLKKRFKRYAKKNKVGMSDMLNYLIEEQLESNKPM